MSERAVCLPLADRKKYWLAVAVRCLTGGRWHDHDIIDELRLLCAAGSFLPHSGV